MFMKHGLSIYSHRLSDGFNDGCNTHQAPDQRRPGNRNPCPKSWRSQILFSKVLRRIHCEKHRKIRVPFLKEWILWEHSEFWNSRRIWRCWHKATSNWTSLKCSPESHHSDWKMDPVSWSVLVVLTPEHGLLSENWGKTTHTHTHVNAWSSCPWKWPQVQSQSPVEDTPHILRQQFLDDYIILDSCC